MECTKVTPECPVEDTTYGYYPNAAGNAFFVAVFLICAIAQMVLGFKYSQKLYPSLVFFGCAGEVAGYIGRLIMHSNPWSSAGFILQILLLIISPSFLAAALYITLKHFVLYYGPQYSKLKPMYYTWLFISCDAIGFLAQLIGGGVTSTAADGKGSPTTVKIGNNIIIAGIAFQAGTMAIAGLVGVDFAYRVYRNRQNIDFAQHLLPKGVKGYNFYLFSTVTAFVTILIRCIYRIPEMAGGWGNKMMRNETEFMILDGTMIAIAAILMTTAYPSTYSPVLVQDKAGRRDGSKESDLDLEQLQLASRDT